ncbi:hypothetical protein BN1723_012195, partial [Verticillium longisporum]
MKFPPSAVIGFLPALVVLAASFEESCGFESRLSVTETQKVKIISCTGNATFTHTTSIVRTLVFYAHSPHVLVHKGYDGVVPTTVTFAPAGTDPGTIIIYTPTTAPTDIQRQEKGSPSIPTISHHSTISDTKHSKSTADPGPSIKAVFTSPATDSSTPSDPWPPTESITSGSQTIIPSSSFISTPETNSVPSLSITGSSHLSTSDLPLPSLFKPLLTSNFSSSNSPIPRPDSNCLIATLLEPVHPTNIPVPSSVSPLPSSLIPNSGSSRPNSVTSLPSLLKLLSSSIFPNSILPSLSSLDNLPSSVQPRSITKLAVLSAIPLSSVQPSQPSSIASSFIALSSVQPSQPSSVQPSQPSSVQPSSFQPSQPSSVQPSSVQPSQPSSVRPSSIAPSSTQSSILPSSSAPAPTPDVTCNNSGLEYALYEHNFRNSDFPAYSSLNVGYFHTRQPLFTGITERIGIPPGTNPSTPFRIYDNAPSRLYQFTAVNHRAFLYAPVTGTYTVTVPVSDDITLVWLGDKAISTWTRANADLEQNYNTVTGPEDTVVFTIQLQAGTYTPFRLLWANAQGRLAFIAQVQAPDGRIIVDGDGSDSSYFVRFACDMSNAGIPT